MLVFPKMLWAVHPCCFVFKCCHSHLVCCNESMDRCRDHWTDLFVKILYRQNPCLVLLLSQPCLFWNRRWLCFIIRGSMNQLKYVCKGICLRYQCIGISISMVTIRLVTISDNAFIMFCWLSLMIITYYKLSGAFWGMLVSTYRHSLYKGYAFAKCGHSIHASVC